MRKQLYKIPKLKWIKSQSDSRRWHAECLIGQYEIYQGLEIYDLSLHIFRKHFYLKIANDINSSKAIAEEDYNKRVTDWLIEAKQ